MKCFGLVLAARKDQWRQSRIDGRCRVWCSVTDLATFAAAPPPPRWTSIITTQKRWITFQIKEIILFSAYPKIHYFATLEPIVRCFGLFLAVPEHRWKQSSIDGRCRAWCPETDLATFATTHERQARPSTATTLAEHGTGPRFTTFYSIHWPRHAASIVPIVSAWWKLTSKSYWYNR